MLAISAVAVTLSLLLVMSLRYFHLLDGILCHSFVVGFTPLFHGYTDPWLACYGTFQIFLFHGCADTIAILRLHVWLNFLGSYGIYSTLNISCTLLWNTTICSIPLLSSAVTCGLKTCVHIPMSLLLLSHIFPAVSSFFAVSIQYLPCTLPTLRSDFYYLLSIVHVVSLVIDKHAGLQYNGLNFALM